MPILYSAPLKSYDGEGKDMKGNAKLIQTLNALLADELTAISQ